jgi:hypothetical protein
LRKREIVLAVAAGGLAAAAAAAILDDDNDGAFRHGPTIVIAGAGSASYNVTNFDQIATEGPQDVVVTQGDAFSVRAEGSPQALALLDARVEGGTLKIGPRDRFSFGGWARLSEATFFVTMPRVDSVALAGSGNVKVDHVQGDSFEGAVAGSGELSIADLKVDDADFRIGGSGSVTAVGTARATRVSIGGSGEIQGGGLRSQTASVSIGGSGDVALNVENTARVSIMGSGDVNISGPARCSVTQMGSGDVRCAGGGGTDGDD